MLQNSKAFGSFSVDDLQKAKAFYRDTLGLNVKDNAMGLLELHLKGGNPMILYPKANHVPANFTVLNFPVKNLEKTAEGMIALGIRFERYPELNTDRKGISRTDGPLIAWFKDPAGNILSVIQDG